VACFYWRFDGSISGLSAQFNLHECSGPSKPSFEKYVIDLDTKAESWLTLPHI
jgi:hypothetical protein